MISFLSILLLNLEHPRYLDILFSDRIYPAMRGAGMDCQDVFMGRRFTQMNTDTFFSLTEPQSHQSKALKECKV